MRYRIAEKSDIDFIAQCFVNISLYLKSISSDIYTEGLPCQIDAQTLNIASSYIENEDAFALICENGKEPVACLSGKIGETSFPESGVGRVGNISMCWVSEEHKEKGIASKLVADAEKWFAQKEIRVVELSYLAQNLLAQIVWDHFGYKPFRVFSHKVF